VEEALADGGRVLHVAVHSFAAQLDGVRRDGDVCFLYDSRRKREAALFRAWGARLAERARALRVRYNYPYLGLADGLPSWLRRRHSEARYLGLELEVNQALLSAPSWRAVGDALAATLQEMLAE
jgi:predicted N-formylglutamate amidohydrolase